MPLHRGKQSSNATKGVSGTNESTAKKQFRINPKLQRTQATGNRQGFVRLSEGRDNVLINGVVRLPNRAVPLNADQPDMRRAGRQPR